jgi:3-isopropylmalate dehydrogenase
MLKYTYGLHKEADAVDRAVGRVVVNHRTKDIMEDGKTLVSTKKMGDLIAAAIEQE